MNADVRVGNRGWKRVVGALSVLALAVPLSDSVVAQRAMYGQAQLSTGFLPDPHILQGQSGGTVNAQQVNPQCNGWISPNPSHIVHLNTNFNWMRVFVDSQGDTTLMVQTPDNTVVCNDDTYGLNPAVERSWGPGMYRIWVGSYQQGSAHPYSLNFTEIQSVVPGNTGGPQTGPAPMPLAGQGGAAPAPVGGGTLQIDATEGNGTPGWIDERLRPDPAVLEGSAGGGIQASRAAGSTCRGYVQSQPDHIMYVQGRARYLRLYVEANSDTTMVIRTPDGRWLCDDDGGEGLNPMIEMDEWPSGQYLLWIGSYQAVPTASVPYRLLASRNRPGETGGSRGRGQRGR